MVVYAVVNPRATPNRLAKISVVLSWELSCTFLGAGVTGVAQTESCGVSLFANSYNQGGRGYSGTEWLLTAKLQFRVEMMNTQF